MLFREIEVFVILFVGVTGYLGILGYGIFKIIMVYLGYGILVELYYGWLVGWLYWCFTALQHFPCHLRCGQLTYPHFPWENLLGSFKYQYWVQILSPVTVNCPSWISGRDRMAVEIILLRKNVAGREDWTRDHPHTRWTRILPSYRARQNFIMDRWILPKGRFRQKADVERRAGV